MDSSAGILVVGGYGVVGRRVASLLATWFPGHVVVSGRDEARARAVSVEIGRETRARRIDADDPASVGSSLDGVGTVISCVAQRGMLLLRASIDRGLAYTDIAPRLAFWEAVEGLEQDARRTGARILLGAGLSPGISNMMARTLAERLGQVERIETAILLSLGDEYGPDARKHVIDAASRAYTVLENGQPRVALPFHEAERVRFPEPYGTRVTYLFPWSDVVYYPKTLGVTTALGRLALEPQWAGRIASLLVRAGAMRWLRRRGIESSMKAVSGLARDDRNHDGFALVVTAVGRAGAFRMSLTGRCQADATAAGAAEIVRALAMGEVAESGVWLPEQVMSHQRFFDAIGSLGWKPTTTEIRAGARDDAAP